MVATITFIENSLFQPLAGDLPPQCFHYFSSLSSFQDFNKDLFVAIRILRTTDYN
jgi:hypothetical protein